MFTLGNSLVACILQVVWIEEAFPVLMLHVNKLELQRAVLAGVLCGRLYFSFWLGLLLKPKWCVHIRNNDDSLGEFGSLVQSPDLIPVFRIQHCTQQYKGFHLVLVLRVFVRCVWTIFDPQTQPFSLDYIWQVAATHWSLAFIHHITQAMYCSKCTSEHCFDIIERL